MSNNPINYTPAAHALVITELIATLEDVLTDSVQLTDSAETAELWRRLQAITFQVSDACLKERNRIAARKHRAARKAELEMLRAKVAKHNL